MIKVDKEAYYTVQDLTELLNKHRLTVYRLLRTGKIEAQKKAGEWIVPGKAIVKYLEGEYE